MRVVCDSRTNGPQARHQTQPISATPATQMLRQVPRKENVDECHTCQAKRRQLLPSATPATQSRGATSDQQRPSAPPEPAQCHKCHTCHASEGGCHQVPCLPRVTGDQRRPSAPPEPKVLRLPRLPRKESADV